MKGTSFDVYNYSSISLIFESPRRALKGEYLVPMIAESSAGTRWTFDKPESTRLHEDMLRSNGIDLNESVLIGTIGALRLLVELMCTGGME